jgi:hypothetical protein
MTQQALYPVPHIRSFILSEAPGNRSRENAVLTGDNAVFQSGALLTQSGDTGAGTFAMDAGATGNPTVGTITVGAAAVAGKYTIEFTAPTKFDVEDPKGVRVGSGTTGVAFSKGGLGFTLTAGGTAAVAGDTAVITVAQGTLKYTRYTAAGAAGPADAVLYNGSGAFTGDKKVTIFVRDCELNLFELTGLDTSGQADLAKRGMVVRGTAGLPTRSTPTL